MNPVVTSKPISGVGRRIAGLTLVELMIVVAVMAILATVAYPLYTEQVRKVRRADGRAAVEMVALAQERFYTVNGRYNVNLATVIIDTTSPLRTGTSPEGYYAVAVAAGPTGSIASSFLVTATPVAGKSQASDSCTSITVNSTGTRGGTGTKCW
jgi:type IV pilus assembly protein PilE